MAYVSTNYATNPRAPVSKRTCAPTSSLEQLGYDMLEVSKEREPGSRGSERSQSSKNCNGSVSKRIRRLFPKIRRSLMKGARQ